MKGSFQLYISETSIIIFIIFVTLNIRSITTKTLNYQMDSRYELVKIHGEPPYSSETCPDGIDVVWTWVNGSDPYFLDILKQNGRNSKSRYRDYNTLFFSMRSVYQYAPFIKNYYIVTLNQVPTFIDPNSHVFGEYKLRIVNHSEIFENQKEIPNFNSNGIESNLQRIKGLSKCFLYLNDDMLLANKLKMSHYIRKDGKFRLYYNGWTAPEVNEMKHNW